MQSLSSLSFDSGVAAEKKEVMGGWKRLRLVVSLVTFVMCWVEDDIFAGMYMGGASSVIVRELWSFR